MAKNAFFRENAWGWRERFYGDGGREVHLNGELRDISVLFSRFGVICCENTRSGMFNFTLKFSYVKGLRILQKIVIFYYILF